jgi:hypothetical protein
MPFEALAKEGWRELLAASDGKPAHLSSRPPQV